MSKKTLFVLWGVLFGVCGMLGFLPEPEGAARTAMTLLAVAFFVPPAALLYRAVRDGDEKTLGLIRRLSALSLGLTVVMLILNFWSALGPQLLGTVLHVILSLVSSPMLCSGHWVLSLFLWACLLMVSLGRGKKKG